MFLSYEDAWLVWAQICNPASVSRSAWIIDLYLPVWQEVDATIVTILQRGNLRLKLTQLIRGLDFNTQ